MLKDKTILLTGGTGSFGQRFTEIALKFHSPKIIRIYSRDELKQWEMDRRFGKNKSLRFFIGDVRDEVRLQRAVDGTDIIIHAAALKQVPICEYNPFEAIKTNIIGAQNVIEAALNLNVEKVLAISTDKAVNPVNLYGATKLCMEKLFIAANAYVGKRKTRMACARYGNVLGSRGSIIPLFHEQKENGKLTITDHRMTRFWITLDQAVDFVIKCLNIVKGGEVFVPKIPSMRIIDLAKVCAPDCDIEYIGIRPGEKLHECLLTEDEARHSIEYDDYYLIKPEHQWVGEIHWQDGKLLDESFRYSSDSNGQWVTDQEIRDKLI